MAPIHDLIRESKKRKQILEKELAKTNEFQTITHLEKSIQSLQIPQVSQLSTAFVYAHGESIPNKVNIPSNVVVVMECSPTYVYSGFQRDIQKWNWFLGETCNMGEGSKFSDCCKSLLATMTETFNNEKNVFCMFTSSCDDIRFSYDDEDLNLGFYQSKSGQAITLDDKSAQEIFETSLVICPDFVKFYTETIQRILPDTPLLNLLKRTKFIQNTLQNHMQVDQDDIDKFLTVCKFLYRTDMDKPKIGGILNTNQENPKTLSELMDKLQQDTNHFHVVIVNACRYTRIQPNENGEAFGNSSLPNSLSMRSIVPNRKLTPEKLKKRQERDQLTLDFNQLILNNNNQVHLYSNKLDEIFFGKIVKYLNKLTTQSGGRAKPKKRVVKAKTTKKTVKPKTPPKATKPKKK